MIFLFTNPVNPTGVVYDETSINSFATILAQFPNVLTICDEIFVDTELGDRRAYSLFACDEIAARVLTLNGVSKSRGYPEINKTGIRFSFAVTLDNDLLEVLRACLGSSTSVDRASACFGILAFSQRASVSAYLEAARMKQRNLVSELRSQLKSLPVRLWLDPPESTSLVMLTFHAMSSPEVGFSTGTAVALWLQKYGLKVVPGELFAIDANVMVVRLSLGLCSISKEHWQRGMTYLKEAVADGFRRAWVKKFTDNTTRVLTMVVDNVQVESCCTLPPAPPNPVNFVRKSLSETPVIQSPRAYIASFGTYWILGPCNKLFPFWRSTVASFPWASAKFTSFTRVYFCSTPSMSKLRNFRIESSPT